MLSNASHIVSQPIAKLPEGFSERVISIIYLAPDPPNMNIDGACAAKILMVLARIQQRLPCVDPARVRRCPPQQFVLLEEAVVDPTVTDRTSAFIIDDVYRSGRLVLTGQAT